MTNGARRSMPLLLTGAVGSALALTACASAGPAAPTSPRPALAPTVAMISVLPLASGITRPSDVTRITLASPIE